MKRVVLIVTLALMGCQVEAAGRLAEVSLINRDTSDILPTYYHHGEYWVAGAPGARYSITINNQSGGRLLAVTAVDGVNVVSGDTAAWGQTGYVYAPGQHYEITGWRKSNDEVAAFEFTAAPNSYAARTGRAVNIGVIGVALFRERVALVAAPMPVMPMAESAASEVSAASQPLADRAVRSRKLGTGHGQREDSHVDNIEFERQQDVPDEVVRIRYDSSENLIAMGVIARPRHTLPVPNPFPDSPLARFVPDPPR